MALVSIDDQRAEFSTFLVHGFSYQNCEFLSFVSIDSVQWSCSSSVGKMDES